MINFNEYMNTWLYKNDGYYSKYNEIGKDGDFYTSVSASPFFGGTIGKKIVDTIIDKKLPKDCTILEIGAHHGYMLADIIQFIYTLKPELLENLNFAIVERYEHLRIQQEKYFKDSFADAINIKFYKDIKEVKLDYAFIVANEIFDAFSCELVYTNEDNILQNAYMNTDTNKIEFKNTSDKYLISQAQKYSIKKGEISIGYEEFISTICTQIKHFEFITFDYGDLYPRNDYSIRVYDKHKVYPLFDEKLNINSVYKKSDITYDVHFNRLTDIFNTHKIKDVVFKTQLKALVEFGITDLLEILKKNVHEDIYLKEVQKVKLLLEPTGMGDRFKMLHITK